MERLFPRALVGRPMCQKTTYTRVGKPGQQHVSLGAPFMPPAKGDKWDTVLGNLWAWDQFGRQGGGVKLHILLIERAVSHRDIQMWEREKTLDSWNGIYKVASGRISFLCFLPASCCPSSFSPSFFRHPKQTQGPLWPLVQGPFPSHLSYFPSHLISVLSPNPT